MNKLLGLVPALFATAITLLSASALAEDADQTVAVDCSSKVAVPNRPKLSSYGDANAFVADIVGYKSKKAQQAAQQQKCPELYDESEPVEEPETLSQAVQTAANNPSAAQPKPSNSPQSDLPQDQLASTSVDTPLSFLNDPNLLPQTLPSLPFDVIEALNSGDISSDKLKDYLSNRLPAEDQATNKAFQIALNGSSQVINMSVSGNLNFYINQDDEIVLTDGIIRTESCLSSGSASGCVWQDGRLIIPSSSGWH